MSLIENVDNIDNISGINKPQKIFYRAVIENNNDPKKANRVQVRILGIHSEIAKDKGDNEGVPVDNLPWAEVINPADKIGGISTYGKTALPLNGTWVWVFFDGGDWNKPIVLGTSVVKPTKPNKVGEVGFQDPTGTYPEEDKIEMGTTRTSANRNIDKTGIITIKDTNRDEEIPTALPNTRYSEEKEQTSKTQYPLNESQAYPDGSFVEYDMSNGGRIHQFHKSGTYKEILPNGAYTRNVVDNDTVIVRGNSNRYIKTNQTVTIQGNSLEKVDVNKTIIIGGSLKETVNGGITMNGGPQIKVEAGIIYLN